MASSNKSTFKWTVPMLNDQKRELCKSDSFQIQQHLFHFSFQFVPGMILKLHLDKINAEIDVILFDFAVLHIESNKMKSFKNMLFSSNAMCLSLDSFIQKEDLLAFDSITFEFEMVRVQTYNFGKKEIISTPIKTRNDFSFCFNLSNRQIDKNKNQQQQIDDATLIDGDEDKDVVGMIPPENAKSDNFAFDSDEIDIGIYAFCSQSKEVKFKKGDTAIRKGKFCVIESIDYSLDPPSVTVKMQNDGNFVGTELKYLSKPRERISEQRIIGKKRKFKEMKSYSPFPTHIIKKEEVTPPYSMFDGHNEEEIKQTVESGVNYLRIVYSEPPKKKRKIEKKQGLLFSLRKGMKKHFGF